MKIDKLKNLEAKLKALSHAEKAVLLRKIHSSLSPMPTAMQKKLSEIEFSLFFFSDNGSENDQDKYRLLIECGKYADTHEFHALWTPERHFNEFGSPYPNPSLLAATLAIVTNNIQLRAGSVVLPLHHPIRVAEEWSVVDNLSRGRIGIACASGWHPDDFILSYQPYEERHTVFKQSLESIQKLWAGEVVEFAGQSSGPTSVELFPKPISDTLPLWLTSAGNPKAWIAAAEMGMNILTGLMEQSIEELKKKIALYRTCLKKNGFSPYGGRVTVMLHTFIGFSNQEVEKIVRKPMMAYLKNHMKMYEKHLRAQKDQSRLNLDAITEEDKQTLLELGFQRYFHENALMGDINKSLTMVQRLSDIGVNEIACLVNFGAKDADILQSLEGLDKLRQKCKERTAYAR